MFKTSHDDPNTAIVVNTANGGPSGEVTVAYLGDFEGDAKGIWPEKLADQCEKNGIKCYTYEHTALEFADSGSPSS